MKDFPLPSGIFAHRFYNLINEKYFKLFNGEEFKVDQNYFSWNAGAMFLPKISSKFLPDVYSLTDQFYPPTQNHAAEQFAFSVIFQKKFDVRACNHVIHHYWYRIDKQIMDCWLNKKININWAIKSEEEKLEFIKQNTKQLPNRIRKNILTKRDKAIQYFHEKKYLIGYKYSFQAILKSPFNKKFIYDILYHTKQFLHERIN